MNEEFYNYLVATDQLDEFLGLKDEALDKEIKDTEDYISKLEEFGIQTDFQEQDLKYNKQRLEELKKRKNEAIREQRQTSEDRPQTASWQQAPYRMLLPTEDAPPACSGQKGTRIPTCLLSSSPSFQDQTAHEAEAENGNTCNTTRPQRRRIFRLSFEVNR